MSLHAFSSVARCLSRLVLAPALVALPAPAHARPDASLVDPLADLNPAYGFDPRAELDPRIEPPEPPQARSGAAARPGSPLRAPVSLAIGASYQQRLLTGEPVLGAMLFLALPLERLAAREVHAAIAEGGSPAPEPAAPGEAREPSGRHKLDLAPPPPPPKLPVPVTDKSDRPLRVPIVVTPEVARSAVDAALRRAHLVDPLARLDALASRARGSAGLPELRLRVLRTVDDGQTLSPVSYDPNRIVAVDAVRFWLEARATWRLDRLLFAEEEIKLERMRHERTEAQTRLTNRVLRLLFEWQRSLATADNPLLPPEENLAARLKALEAEAELDLLTDGWFARWRAPASGAAP